MLLRHVLTYAVHRQAIYMFLERKCNVHNAEYLFGFLCFAIYSARNSVFVLFSCFISSLGNLFLFYLMTSASFLSSLIGMIIISCFLLLAYMKCDVRQYF